MATALDVLPPVGDAGGGDGLSNCRFPQCDCERMVVAGDGGDE